MLSEFHVSAKAVITCDTKALVLESKDTPDLPGGRLEPGETPVIALTRELSEELPGIGNIEIGELVGWHLYPDYQSKGTDLMIMIFHVEAWIPDPIALSEEHDLAEWLSIPELKDRFSEFGFNWHGSFGGQ